MDRRTFFRLSSLAGLSAFTNSAPGLLREAHAGSLQAWRTPYDGPCVIFIQALGGWDSVLLCDPKGASNLEDPRRISNYKESDIQSAGNIRFAPSAENAKFFNKHYKNLLVINGIDTKSNVHQASRRNVFSGTLGLGYPNLAAMVAGHFDPSLAMSFMSFGGYDDTEGVVPRSRSGNFGALNDIAYPRRSNPTDASSVYHSAQAQALIEAARKERQAYLRSRVQLPRAKAGLNTLFTAEQGADGLRRLQDYLPTLDRSDNPLNRQSQLALAAYRAGISVSANLTINGFDTHDNHDERHIPLIDKILQGINFLWDEAERQGIADRLVVVVGSDFGRTPRYNNKAGKDHWSITSMMLMGAGIQGNRVIGKTDEGLQAMELSASTLAPDPSGIVIEPKHIHHSLRRLTRLSGGELDKRFPIESTFPELF